jgi:hypothetical protein
MTMRITLLLEPSAGREVPFAAGAERYRRFAEELAHYAGTPVPVVKAALNAAPEGGYVLFAARGDLARSLADCDPEQATRLPGRLVLLDVSWQQALAELERHRLAAAVDSLRMSEWLARPSGGKGPFGLRHLAKTLGVSCVPLPCFQSAHYCLLDSAHHHGMPHLLADYLTAYDRDPRPPNARPSAARARAEEARAAGAADTARKAAKEGGDS